MKRLNGLKNRELILSEYFIPCSTVSEYRKTASWGEETNAINK